MEVPAHLRIRMAKRNLSHAYLVVGENRRPLAEALGRRLGLYRGDPSLRALPGCRKAGLGIHPDITGRTQRGRA